MYGLIRDMRGRETIGDLIRDYEGAVVDTRQGS